MTPPRLTELRCPGCHHVSWVIDSDYRGMDGVMLPYRERHYACAHCRHDGPGWEVEQQSPPEFLLQPHDLYPMTQAAFNHWVEILRTHCPTHPALNRLGTTFLPRLPEEVEAMRDVHARAHPVAEMTDQDGARRAEPDLRTAYEWLEIMQLGDALLFRRRDGGTLHLRRDVSGQAARCLDETGAALTEAMGLDEETVREVIQQYLDGNTVGCIRRIRQANAGALARLWNQVVDPS
jgi:hypothetical protein